MSLFSRVANLFTKRNSPKRDNLSKDVSFELNMRKRQVPLKEIKKGTMQEVAFKVGQWDSDSDQEQ